MLIARPLPSHCGPRSSSTTDVSCAPMLLGSVAAGASMHKACEVGRGAYAGQHKHRQDFVIVQAGWCIGWVMYVEAYGQSPADEHSLPAPGILNFPGQDKFLARYHVRLVAAPTLEFGRYPLHAT